MARKNNRKKAKKRLNDMIRHETERAEESAMLADRRKSNAAKRQAGDTGKRPKVAPVVSSEAKKKKLLAK